MRTVLVLGGTGLTGRRLVEALLQGGFLVRCAVRDLDAARARLPAAAELVRGDIADRASIEAAVRGCEAVFNCVHTLSPQKGAAPGETFVDTELRGLENVVAACRIHGVRRVLYVTFLGITPDTPSIWARGRWKAEQMLLGSGLDVTILRPGQIVGRGGFGFDTTLANARRRVALILGSGRSRMQNIALDDLVHYLVRSLDEPRTFGRAFDVGGDEAFTTDEMVDVAARVLGRRPPWKLHLLPWLLAPFAGLFERLAGLPRGAFADLLLGLDADLVGDVGPIRAIIPLTPMPYAQAVERALADSWAGPR
ncbi:SDR family oxidoreductase [Sorangium sp. So ce1182]|uniref:SDR family oxidoreductase n=1 Tax=Sorangium sp. So ce1182 TaxID=3133334 RepID=UPI003F619281